MSAPQYARLASKLFVREGDWSAAPPPTHDTRNQAIASIAAAIDQRARRRRTARWSGGSMAVAAAAAAVLAVTHHESRKPLPVAINTPSRPVQITAHSVGGVASVVVSGAEAPLAEGRPVAEGSRLVTPPDGRATLAFSTGTSVVVGEGTDMTLGGEGDSQLLRLNTGWIDLHVAKLMTGQRFVVDTSDSEVEVRGTRFRVSIARPDPSCGDGTTTRLSVTEGVVVIRHGGVEDRVAAGEHWPEHCAAAMTSWTPTASRTAAGTPGVPAAAGAVPISTLAEQNNLFAEAFASKRDGDVSGALAAFDRYLSKYPGSAPRGRVQPWSACASFGRWGRQRRSAPQSNTSPTIQRASRARRRRRFSPVLHEPVGGRDRPCGRVRWLRRARVELRRPRRGDRQKFGGSPGRSQR